MAPDGTLSLPTRLVSLSQFARFRGFLAAAAKLAL
jgi:hypothetical protein